MKCKRCGQENGEENNKFYQTSINQQNKTVTNTFEVPDEKINVTVTKNMESYK